MPTLVDDNIACLRQGVALLQDTDNDQFAQGQAVCYGSSIGQHMRHNIDHYLSFIRGRDRGEIDYDARARDPQLEQVTAVAIKALEEIIAELTAIPPAQLDRPLAVIMDSGSAIPEPAQSSTRRELQFLLSHTVHHYALIGIIRRLQGAAPSADFGVAPSTIKHQQAS